MNGEIYDVVVVLVGNSDVGNGATSRSSITLLGVSRTAWLVSCTTVA